MGVVYKLTCKTGRVYFGSTKNTFKIRKSKGWKNCSCGDFEIIKEEELEFIDNETLLLERETYYIRNFNCVNKNLPICDKELQKERNRNNPNKKECCLRYRKRVVEEKRFHCNLCDISFQAKDKFKRHIDGVRHKLKNKSYEKYGDDWKKYYLEDNKKRYNENRRVKK